jgi:putative FmdB family regulatory protein
VPLYEYECSKCGRRFERIEIVSASTTKKCPHCGAKAKRLPCAPAIQFKGSGWYVTDYAGKNSAAAAAAEKGEGKSTEASADSPADKTAKKSTETKDTSKKKSN